MGRGRHVESIKGCHHLCKSSARRARKFSKKESKRLRRRLEARLLEDTPIRLTKGWAD